MGILELIEQLENISSRSGRGMVVRAWCPDGQDYFPITGLIFGEDGFLDVSTEPPEDYDED